MDRPNIIDIRNANKSKINLHGNSHQFIIVHYLGVKNADNPYVYNYDGQTSYGGHFNITRDGSIYQAADYNDVLWQVGTGGYYTKKYPNGWDPTNFNCIGIECSVCYDTDWYFTKETEESLVKLVKWLVQDLGLDNAHVLRHYDVVNKVCPAPYVNNNKHNGNMTWDEFKKRLEEGDEDMVSDILKDLKISKLMDGSVRYVNVSKGDYLNCRVAPSADAPMLSKWGHLGRGNGVNVLAKTANNWALVSIMNEQVGWVNARYLSKTKYNDL